MLNLFQGCLLGLLLLLLEELSLIERNAQSLTLVSLQLNEHLLLGIHELFFILLSLSKSLLLIFLSLQSLGCSHGLIILNSIQLSLPFIDLLLLSSLGPRRLDLLLSLLDPLLLRKIALVLLLDLALTFLAHNEKLLIEVGIVHVLSQPLHGCLNRLPLAHGHEQGFLGCVLRESHLLQLLHHVLFHIRCDGRALAGSLIASLATLLLLGHCLVLLLLELLSQGQ